MLLIARVFRELTSPEGLPEVGRLYLHNYYGTFLQSTNNTRFILRFSANKPSWARARCLIPVFFLNDPGIHCSLFHYTSYRLLHTQRWLSVSRVSFSPMIRGQNNDCACTRSTRTDKNLTIRAKSTNILEGVETSVLPNFCNVHLSTQPSQKVSAVRTTKYGSKTHMQLMYAHWLYLLKFVSTSRPRLILSIAYQTTFRLCNIVRQSFY